MRSLRLGAFAAAALAGSSLLFVVFHSGPLGKDACVRQGFSGPGSLSLDPLGTLCRGGENGRYEAVLVNNYFWLTSGAVLLAALVLALLWLVMRGGNRRALATASTPAGALSRRR